jgi:hypothetical protein
VLRKDLAMSTTPVVVITGDTRPVELNRACGADPKRRIVIDGRVRSSSQLTHLLVHLIIAAWL